MKAQRLLKVRAGPIVNLDREKENNWIGRGAPNWILGLMGSKSPVRSYHTRREPFYLRDQSHERLLAMYVWAGRGVDQRPKDSCMRWSSRERSWYDSLCIYLLLRERSLTGMEVKARTLSVRKSRPPAVLWKKLWWGLGDDQDAW